MRPSSQQAKKPFGELEKNPHSDLKDYPKKGTASVTIPT
jgi:hypothetical protein